MATLTNITLENISLSLEIDWKIAHRAKDRRTWLRRWEEIIARLNAYHEFMNWNRSPEDKGVDALMDDILWLREITRKIRYSF